jgi:tetratricopeptide (TPR) repeat protein
LRHTALPLPFRPAPYEAVYKDLLIEIPKHERRRNPRYRAPKDLLIGWQGAGKRNVSNAEELGVGGVFLLVAHPLSAGTHVEMLFDVPGGEVRARAIVRHGRPGHGMGVQFVHMGAADRARLHRFIKQLAEESSLETIPPPSSWFERGALPLDSGEIKTHHELLALLNKIYSTRLTGQLQLVLGRVERHLFFDGGQLVFATSSDRQDSLGEMMLREGALTQSQFEAATELVKTGQRFGSAVAEMGIFAVEQVVLWVQRQLTQITSSVLDYPSGRFYFFSSLEKNVVPEIGIPVPLGKLLLEAVRRAKDLPLEHLAADAALRIDLSPDPMLRYQAVDLDDTERRLLLSISRPVSVKDFLANCTISKDSAARALYALMVLGAVISVPAPAQSEQPVQQAAQSASATPTSAPEQRAAVAAAPEPPCSASAEDSPDTKKFEEEIRALLQLAGKSTYYDLLGVTATSPPELVKENFHRMARKFHPDRHMGHSEWLDLLQDLMGRLTIAYKTIVDAEKRAAYDKQIAAAGAFTLAKQALRARNFAGSILWLRKCVEIAPNVAKHHAMLARSLAAIPQYRQDAVRHFSLALELDAWNTSTYFQFGELYEVMRLPWRAVPLYRRILEIDPQHAKAIERLAALETNADSAKTKSEKSFISRLFQRKA